MVHARNVKPPVAGATLVSVDESSVRQLPGFIKVVRKRNNQEITNNYEGKLDGDTIKGKASTETNGNTRTREFEAKREKAAA